MNTGGWVHVGCGVFVSEGPRRGFICLSTDSQPSNVIYLTPDTWRTLKAWVENLDKPTDQVIGTSAD